MKKILLISSKYPPDRGGVAGYTESLARALSEDIIVDVLTTGINEFSEEVGSSNFKVMRQIPSWGFRGFWKINKILRQGKYDCVNIQYVPHAYGWLGINVALPVFLIYWRITGVRFSFFCHEIALPISIRYIKWLPFALFNWLVYITIVLCSKQVGVSCEKWKKYTEKVFFWCKNKCHSIPIFSTFEGIETRSDSIDNLKIRYGLDDIKVTMVFMGGLHPSRLIRYVIDSFDYLISKRYEVKLLCVGVDTEKIIKLIPKEKGHLKKSLILTGYLEDAEIAELINFGDLFLCPYSDGVSMRRSSLMAALCFGLPIITTKTKYTERVFYNLKFILMSNSDDKEGFISNVERMIKDKENLKVFGKKAKDFYEKHFSLKQVKNTYLKKLLQ